MRTPSVGDGGDGAGAQNRCCTRTTAARSVPCVTPVSRVTFTLAERRDRDRGTHANATPPEVIARAATLGVR